MSKKKPTEQEVAANQTDPLGGHVPPEGPLVTDPSQKPTETKAEKFRRLIVRRVNNALKHLQYVANLGDRRNYVYTEEEAKKVVGTINNAADAVLEAFSGSDKAEKGGWTL